MHFQYSSTKVLLNKSDSVKLVSDTARPGTKEVKSVEINSEMLTLHVA